MERYPTDARARATFDTGQFSEVQVMAALSSFEQARTKSVIHSIGIGGSILSIVPPVVDGGRIFVGACDKHVYCVSLDGREVWRFKADGLFLNSGALDGDTYYAASYDGNLYALDAATGRKRWSFHTQDKIIGTAVPFQGMLLLASTDGNVYGLSREGRLRWTLPLRAPAHMVFDAASPPVWGDLAFVGTMDGRCVAVTADGRVRWAYQTRGDFCTHVRVRGDTVYFGSTDQAFYSLDAATGKKRWTFQAKNLPYAYALTEEVVFVSSRDHHVYALDRAAGKRIWTFQAGDMVWGIGSPPFRGVLYVGCVDGKLCALDAATGRLRWTFAARGPIWHGPAVAGERLIFGSHDCRLYCLDLQGKLQWAFPTSLSTPSPIEPADAPTATLRVEAAALQEAAAPAERYQSQTLGEGGSESVYTFKSEYTTKSLYTSKKR